MSTNFLQFSHPCVTRIIICTVLKDSLRFEIFLSKIYLNYSRESREFRCTKKSSSTIETVQVKFSTLKFIYVILLISRIYIFATIFMNNGIPFELKFGKIVANIHEQNINVPLSASQLGQISIDVRVNAISFSAGGYNQRGIGVN